MARVTLQTSKGGPLIARLRGGCSGPISNHIGTQRRRRLTVLAVYAGYPTMVGAMWASSTLQKDHAGIAERIPVVIVLLLAFAALGGGVAGLLGRTTINVANLPTVIVAWNEPDPLDE